MGAEGTQKDRQPFKRIFTPKANLESLINLTHRHTHTHTRPWQDSGFEPKTYWLALTSRFEATVFTTMLPLASRETLFKT